MAVILIGTLDTKGGEIGFVRDLLVGQGFEVKVIDAGCMGEPAIAADVTRQVVFEAAGSSLQRMRDAADRGKAVETTAAGVTKIVLDLHGKGDVSGVLSLGGSAGTIIGTSAMRALPFGVPKLMVSTLASGNTRPYVESRDIMMLNSVVDISGINRISRIILHNAATAMAGMVKPASEGSPVNASADKPLIAATMFGVTTPCVEAARKVLEQAGYEVLVFHATGTGGQAMESLIADGLIAGVLDITTTELADELVGGVLSAGPDRLTAAAKAGVPQVISVGAMDMVNFGPRDSVPQKFANRTFYQHNPAVTLMRTTAEENDKLGLELAQKASASKRPVTILLPLLGVSAIDREGQPFHDPGADRALFDSIRQNTGPNVEVAVLQRHINDVEFAEAAAGKLLEMIVQK